jgi:phage tail-like protein
VTVAIVVQGEDGKDVARFEITEAWPSKYDPMDLNAKGNDVSIETLELVNEGVVRTA